MKQCKDLILYSSLEQRKSGLIHMERMLSQRCYNESRNPNDVLSQKGEGTWIWNKQIVATREVHTSDMQKKKMEVNQKN